jgi:hypothetical protein
VETGLCTTSGFTKAKSCVVQKPENHRDPTGARLGGVGVNVGCNAELRPNWRAISELKLPFWLSGDSDNESYWQPKLSIGSQYDINQTNAIRVTASREWLPKSDSIHNVDEVALKWLHYFE